MSKRSGKGPQEVRKTFWSVSELPPVVKIILFAGSSATRTALAAIKITLAVVKISGTALFDHECIEYIKHESLKVYAI